jgi:hypothetical protein
VQFWRSLQVATFRNEESTMARSMQWGEAAYRAKPTVWKLYQHCM